MQSIRRLAMEVPKLRQVSLVAAMFFACFTAFWTTLVFLLETPPYHYGSQAAGLFGLVGAAGRRWPQLLEGLPINEVQGLW